MTALLGPAGSVFAQDAPSELPMCDPVTLDTLFPSEEHDDGEIGDEKPTADQSTEEVSLVDPARQVSNPQVPDPQPAQVDSERSAPGTQNRPAPSESPSPKPAPKQENCRPFVYDMLSPTAAQPGVISTFGVPRPNGRKHKGADIAAPKMTPVYAVSDGTVFWILDQQGGDCCAVGLRHPDGWMSYYIHLNNDTFGTDDGLGYGIAPGITKGTQVAAGQLIGWIGDSGNAETTVPHVHFELRTPANEAIDAIPSLGGATVSSLFSATASNASRSYTEPFDDDDDTAFEPLFGRLASLGLLTGCGDPVGVSFCPDDPVSGEAAITMIESFTGVSLDAATILNLETDAAVQSATGELADAERCPVNAYCPKADLTNAQLSLLVATAIEELAEPAKLKQAERPAGALAPAAQVVDAGNLDETLPVSIPTLPPLIIARCEDLPDHASRLGNFSTRGELVLYLAEETGLIEAVPCGQLR